MKLKPVILIAAATPSAQLEIRKVKQTFSAVVALVLLLFAVVSGFSAEVPQPAGQAGITGLFDAGWNSASRTAEQWDQQMQNLIDLGCDTLILQYSLQPPHHAYYPSSLAWSANIPADTNCIHLALEAAAKRKINVYIGLYYEYTKEWWGTPSNTYLEKQRTRCIEVFRELELLYGQNSCVVGYYLPHEIARYYWQNPNDRQRLIVEFLEPVTAVLHRESNKKLMVSPFFNSKLETPQQLNDFWQDLLQEWSPDIVAVQDGLGVGHATLDNAGAYLKAIHQAVSAKNLEFWVNVELFEGKKPASISRIKAQIAVAEPYAKKVIAYDYATITQNHRQHVMNKLFEELKAGTMPKFDAPLLFDTPEADVILSTLEVFPTDNAWNTPVDVWPVAADSTAMIAAIGANKPLRYNPDMGFVLVPPDQKTCEVALTTYASESDPRPYPVPDNVPIEGWPASFKRDPKTVNLTLDDVQRGRPDLDADRHAIIVDPAQRKLYEFYRLTKTDNGWTAEQASVFDLASNRLRPAGWTSADAAGLPIFPAVVRHDEIERGRIEHALRVTFKNTRQAYVYPATHYASQKKDPNLPRMGERLRLRKDFDTSAFPPAVKTILEALKRYGMICADNGIDWAISVTPDERIPVLHDELRKVKGADFEVVMPPQGYVPPK